MSEMALAGEIRALPVAEHRIELLAATASENAPVPDILDADGPMVPGRRIPIKGRQSLQLVCKSYSGCPAISRRRSTYALSKG